MYYKNEETKIFMDTGNFLEWLTLYCSFKRIIKKDEIVGIRLTRKMAYALMKEIENRLFGGSESVIFNTISENNQDYCFNFKTKKRIQK